MANRVARMGAMKAPQLRNVELTGPYFHTGSYLTLRQVVDFYIRGGDFPVTNAEHRDPNIVDVNRQAFGFGPTENPPALFADGYPDTIFRYGFMPDTRPPGCDTVPVSCTPEPADATQEAAKVALVKYLLSLTDKRVKIEAAPFDRPEIFVPLDGLAPDNTLGPGGAAPAAGTLGALSLTTCTGTTPTAIEVTCFSRIPAVGAGGHPATPLPNFLGIASVPTPGDSNDHFDRK